MAAIFDKVKTFASNGFIRSVGVLIGGTALAQVIIALSLPVATRLYSPGDFSQLALFTAIVSIISVAACLRFDIALPIPETDAEAANLLALAVGFSVLVSAALALLVIFASQPISAFLNAPGFQPYLWLVPFAVLLASLYNTFQSWFIRRRAFRGIAATRISQAGAAAITQIGLGVLHPSPLGLLLGFAINSGAGCIGLGYQLIRSDAHILRSVSWTPMKAAFLKNSQFPKYSTLEAICNNASIYLPIILISSLAVGPEAGYVLLAMQVMQAPMILIGSAISQVYLSRAPEEYRSGRLGVFTAQILGGLLKIGVGPLIFVGIVSPGAFAIVFGDEWRRAGELVTWMTPWFVMQFLASPISVALHVTGNQKSALLLQLFGLVLRVGTLYLAHFTFSQHLSESYAFSGFVFYLIYAGVVLKLTATTRGSVLLQLQKSAIMIGIWIAVGVAGSILLETLLASFFWLWRP